MRIPIPEFVDPWRWKCTGCENDSEEFMVNEKSILCLDCFRSKKGGRPEGVTPDDVYVDKRGELWSKRKGLGKKKTGGNAEFEEKILRSRSPTDMMIYADWLDDHGQDSKANLLREHVTAFVKIGSCSSEAVITEQPGGNTVKLHDFSGFARQCRLCGGSFWQIQLFRLVKQADPGNDE